MQIGRFVSKVSTRHLQSAPFTMIGSGCQQHTYCMVAESVVVSQRILCLPCIGTISGFLQVVAENRFTHLVTNGIELLKVICTQVISKAADKLQTRNYVVDIQAGSAPHITRLVINVFSFEQANRIHSITMSIRKVTSILLDVFRIFCCSTTIASIQRIVNSSAGRHVDCRDNRARKSVVVRILGTATRILPSKVFADAHPLVQFKFAVVT